MTYLQTAICSGSSAVPLIEEEKWFQFFFFYKYKEQILNYLYQILSCYMMICEKAINYKKINSLIFQ